MKHSFFDLLCTSLVPELGSDVSAGTSCDIQLILIGVAAVRTSPDKLSVFVFFYLDLSVIAAYLTLVALGIELCVHDRIVDMLHDCKDCRNVVLHVRNLNIGNRAAR